MLFHLRNGMQEHNRASEWFNELYKKNQDNHENIPWARQAVNPLLESYLLDDTQTHKGKALVIGCGLGDDAYALELAGYEVVAIDVSEVALKLASTRFKDSGIHFLKQDIFDMPQIYKAHFDFVFEAFTIQSLPIKFRKKMIESISQTLKVNAKILVVAHKKQREFPGPPWPLKECELNYFKENDLEELSREVIEEESGISNYRFKVLYQVPQSKEVLA